MSARKTARSTKGNSAVNAETTEDALETAQRRAHAALKHEAILGLKGELDNVTYRLAVALKLIRDQELFRDLESPCRTWDEYVEHSVKLRARQVAKWILVASTFSEADVNAYGVEKLYLLAKWLLVNARAVPARLASFKVADEDGDLWLFAELSVVQAEKLLRVEPAGRIGGVTAEEREFAKLVCALVPELAGQFTVEVVVDKDGPLMVLRLRKPERFQELVSLLSARMHELSLPAPRLVAEKKTTAKKTTAKKKTSAPPTAARVLEDVAEEAVADEAPARRAGPAKITVKARVEAPASGEPAGSGARTQSAAPPTRVPRADRLGPALDAVRMKKNETAQKARAGWKSVLGQIRGFTGGLKKA